MKIRALGTIAGHACLRGAVMLGLWLVVASRAAAGIGELDVRFGTNGEIVVDGETNGAVLALPDGRLVVVGTPGPNASALSNEFAVHRFSASGSPDASFGAAGRAVVRIPLEQVWIRSAALQPDGKVVVAGYGTRNTGQSVRLLARITAEGLPDAGFGVNGVVIGGYGGWGGYAGVLVLPSGEILAAYSDEERFFDRFLPNGVLAANLPQDAAPDRMALLADGRVIVVGQKDRRGVAWRLQADGRLDTSFGDSGYAGLNNYTTSALAIEPDGDRIVVCGDRLIERLTADGRRDTTFGPQGSGWVTFYDQSDPKITRCDGLLANPDGSVVVGASDVQGFEEVLSHAYVIGLRPNGSRDPKFGSGTGHARFGTPSAPGTRQQGVALLRTSDQNALSVWRRFTLGDTRTIIHRVDLGSGGEAGAVGVPLQGLRVREGMGTAVLDVVRSGGASGAASVRFETVPTTAGSGDFRAVAGLLHWSDGDAGAKSIELSIVDDGEFEGEESFQVRLFAAEGVAVATETFTVIIDDDEALQGLRFVDTEATVNAGAASALMVSRDDHGAGPVTVYYAIWDGWDGPFSSVGRLSWGAGERGEKAVPLLIERGMEDPNIVSLISEQWDWLDATGKVPVGGVVAPVPTPAPAPAPSPPPSVESGGGGGGGRFDWVILAVCLCAAAYRIRKEATAGLTTA
jgi:uncharacterized delta-60 repeat protein